jgi:hypothetical protein
MESLRPHKNGAEVMGTDSTVAEFDK